MANDIFLKLTGIHKSFGGVHALKGVDLTIRKGEIHCLAGENGCGKSTLIKAISGVHDVDSGTIEIEGEVVQHMKPIDAIRKGIQVIYQDFAVFPNLTVAENIALNGEVLEGRKTVNWKQIHEIADKAMKQVGADLDPDIPLEMLPVAGKQMVAICRAIINDCKLLILDEPTTALTEKEVQQLWKVIRGLKKKGIAIMIVNHKLDEIYEIADRLTILRNGAFVSTGTIDEYDDERFIHDMTGKEIDRSKYMPPQSNEEIFRVENLTLKGAFRDVSFSVDKGDVVGITGLLGSGRGEIGEALFGVTPPDSGKIVLNGKEIKIHSIEDAIKNKIAYVPEDRLTEGLFINKTVKENMMASSIRKYFHGIKLNDAEMTEASRNLIKELNVVTPSEDVPVRTLSGGNAQKVVIAKWLNTNPKLFILNGPTVGVDIGAKSEIHSILRRLAKQGIGIIIISDDMRELIQNCNKIIVMKHGVVGAITDNKQDNLSL